MKFLFCMAYTLFFSSMLFSQAIFDSGFDSGVLIPASKTAFLENEIAHLKSVTGIQLLVYIPADLHGQSIEDESMHFFSQWQLEHSAHDSTLLLLIAPKEKLCFIDLGYGLDDLITTSQAKKICETEILPLLQNNKSQEAVEVGIRAIFHALGASFIAEGGIHTRAVYTTRALVIFVGTIICLYFVARLAPTRFFFLSPTIGFIAGYFQSIGLAVVLAALGLVMVVLSYLLSHRTPPRLRR